MGSIELFFKSGQNNPKIDRHLVRVQLLMPETCYIAAAPLISCEIVATPSGLRTVSAIQPSPSFICILHTEHYKKEILGWLKKYAKRNPSLALSIPCDFGPLTLFQRTVLAELERILFGQTASYKEVAQSVGTPLGARAIGNVCNINPLPLFIPCHRVISASGRLGGFAYGSEVKKRLLDFENLSLYPNN